MIRGRTVGSHTYREFKLRPPQRPLSFLRRKKGVLSLKKELYGSIGPSEHRQIMKVNVPKGYKCPFCDNHQDDVFYASSVINTPICEGCSEELFIFSQCDEGERPDDFMIDIWEKRTGLSWAEIRKRIRKENKQE